MLSMWFFYFSIAKVRAFEFAFDEFRRFPLYKCVLYLRSNVPEYPQALQYPFAQSKTSARTGGAGYAGTPFHARPVHFCTNLLTFAKYCFGQAEFCALSQIPSRLLFRAIRHTFSAHGKAALAKESDVFSPCSLWSLCRSLWQKRLYISAPIP